MEITYLIIAIVALCVGFLISKLLVQQKLISLKAELVKSNEYLTTIQNEKQQLLQDKEKLIIEKVRAETNLRNREETLSTQNVVVEEMLERNRFEFKNIAQIILEEKSETFAKANEQKMGELLTPLKTQLVEFKQKVEDTYDKESKERFTLSKEIEKLITTTMLVSQEANNLSSALKGSVKTQGNWGEMILESILEHSGLTRNREYFTQEFIKDSAGNIIKDEEGKGLQPDIIVKYPDQRTIIIDSKVSLIAWEQYSSANDIVEKKNSLQQHIISIKQHVAGLSKKNYPKYAKALDYVLMFVPIEPAFLEALKEDTALWKFAYDKQIMLVSPTNLLAVLKIIADLWKVEQQNKNAIDIANKAGDLYDKFVGFTKNMESIGSKINEAQNAYSDAYKQLSSGRGNIVSKIEDLKLMGANAQKQLPDKILYELKID